MKYKVLLVIFALSVLPAYTEGADQAKVEAT